MSKQLYHAQVNHVAGSVVLCRIKEFGTNSKTLKVSADIFGEVPPQKGESFVIESDICAEQGNYLYGADNKVITRELANAKPFDPAAAMATAEGVEDEPTF